MSGRGTFQDENKRRNHDPDKQRKTRFFLQLENSAWERMCAIDNDSLVFADRAVVPGKYRAIPLFYAPEYEFRSLLLLFLQD